jgi:hypothetical protein
VPTIVAISFLTYLYNHLTYWIEGQMLGEIVILLEKNISVYGKKIQLILLINRGLIYVGNNSKRL